MSKIPLVRDTIDRSDIDAFKEWLGTDEIPRLTKGDLTEQFEAQWSKWLGVEYSVFVNSGSSANLAVAMALSENFKYYRGKSKSVIVPAVSWATTVMPWMQLGFKPILCECDKKTLGLDVDHLRELCRRESPVALMLVHVLGVPCNMKEILNICTHYDVTLLEDSCESTGSKFLNDELQWQKTGTAGWASTFSFYAGHTISTTEGGMVCTNDDSLYLYLKSIRAHGWDRDLGGEEQHRLRTLNDIDDFRALYSFYYSAFNLRPTDIQAFFGLRQMLKIDKICAKREENFRLYNKLIQNDYWKLPFDPETQWIVNFAYPFITSEVKLVERALKENNIETRPLVAGNIGRQPFWKEVYGGGHRFSMADAVHDYGLYLPNNHLLTNEEIEKVCRVANEAVNG
jgi:CDP-6-deoxy-D-xylo-4-hexulose-3-dehydrase